MSWWPCFRCDSTDVCPHRERELVTWMFYAPPAPAVAAAWPVANAGIAKRAIEPKRAVREITRPKAGAA